MKTTRLLRMLSLLGFLLLMAPFYDSCSSRKGLFVKSYDYCNADGTPVVKSFTEKTYEVVVDELSFNGFEIAYIPILVIRDITYEKFKTEFTKSFQNADWYKELVLFSYLLIFDFIVVFSFLIFGFSFTKRIKTLNKLALVNSILVIVTLLYIIFLESSFKHFHQIKWGYYAFIPTSILIFYFSKKAIKNTSK